VTDTATESRGLEPGKADGAPAELPPPVLFGVEGLSALIEILRAHGYQVLGPTVRDGAILYGPVRSADDLPRGHTDAMGPAHYRLASGDGGGRFGYTLGVQGWKRFLHPEALTLWRGRRTAAGVEVDHDASGAPQPLAFLGVRACELAAIRIQDRVLRDGPVADPVYADRRERVFIVAANCTSAAATCFCASVGAGPRAGEGADLILTELVDDGTPRYVCSAESPRGVAVLADIPHAPAAPGDLAAAAAAAEQAERSMGRILESVGQPRASALGRGGRPLPDLRQLHDGLPDLLLRRRSRTHRPHRRASPSGGGWDSCFTSTSPTCTAAACRPASESRYRQWMTHKLATWSTSSAPPAASAAGAASPGARSGSTSPRRCGPSRDHAAGLGEPMEIHTRALLAEHPFFAGPGRGARTRCIAGCAGQRRFEPGEFVFREGEPADRFYLIRHGRVALDLCSSRTGARSSSTRSIRARCSAGPGWCRPTAGTSTPGRSSRPGPVARRHLPARQVRRRPGLGYDLMKRFAAVMEQRLHARGCRLLDMYGKPAAETGRRLRAPRLDPMLREGSASGNAAAGDRDTFTLRSSPATRRHLAFAPGQFNMLYAFGVGEVPISISGDPGAGALVHTVRAVGASRGPSARCSRATWLGVRGPFGSAWPWPPPRARRGHRGRRHRPGAAAAGDPTHPRAPRRFGRWCCCTAPRTPADILFRGELERWRGASTSRCRSPSTTADPTGRPVGVVTADRTRRVRPGEAWHWSAGRLTLAVWKFASCDGCQLTLLDCEDELLASPARSRSPTSSRRPAPVPRGPLRPVAGRGLDHHAARRRAHPRDPRAVAVLVTIGACATAGGIQALRNFADVEEFTRIVYAGPATSTRWTPRRRSPTTSRSTSSCAAARSTRPAARGDHARSWPGASRASAHSVCIECKRRGTSA
jgi:sulfhydrogenase subunit beta (sulfur reductase)